MLWTIWAWTSVGWTSPAVGARRASARTQRVHVRMFLVMLSFKLTPGHLGPGAHGLPWARSNYWGRIKMI